MNSLWANNLCANKRQITLNWYDPKQASSSYLYFFFSFFLIKHGFSEQMFHWNKFSWIRNNHLLLLENVLMKESQKTQKTKIWNRLKKFCGADGSFRVGWWCSLWVCHYEVFFFHIIRALTWSHALYVFSIEHIIDTDTISCTYVWQGNCVTSKSRPSMLNIPSPVHRRHSMGAVGRVFNNWSVIQTATLKLVTMFSCHGEYQTGFVCVSGRSINPTAPR